MALTPPPWHDPDKPAEPRVGIVPFARKLRKTSTEAERCLWKSLRNRRCRGHKFRRQHPVPPYILDFYREELKVAIELDRGGHFLDAQKEHDERRSQYLATQGIRVICLKNSSLLDPDGRLMCWLWQELEKLEM